MRASRSGRAWLIVSVLAAACSDATSDIPSADSTGSPTAPTDPGTAGSSDTMQPDGDPSTSTAMGDSTGATQDTGDTGDRDDHELADLCENGLPFALTRRDRGEPIDPAERTAVTARYLELLDALRYFDFIAERAHGWPIDDPRGRYWFGTWWSGVTVVKEDGTITYRHGPSGADNNGLRTGPILEGACYAYALWGRPEDELLVRMLMRGFSSWILSMERAPDDPDAPMLDRAFYPESIAASQAGVEFFIDYGANRPGIDADPSEYVHVPENPWWGDVWIKNKRSKDDIGHMLRGTAQLGACRPLFVDPAAEDDFAQMRSLYAAWARRVEDDGWRIATLDKNGDVWLPNDLLAYFLPDAECNSILAIRLSGRGDPGMLDCGNGIGRFDALIIGSNDHNGQIVRSFHEAAANHALVSGQHEVAQAMLDGIVLRMTEGLDSIEGTGPTVPWLGVDHQVDMLLHALALGVPLTSREIAWLHARIDEAHAGYMTPANATIVDVFSDTVPDGSYAFAPWGPAIEFNSLGGPLAACASPCVDPRSEPLLDCDLVAAWRPSR